MVSLVQPLRTYGEGELFKMPIEGGAATQFTTSARVWRSSRIAWSPEGDRIAFQSIRAGPSNLGG